MARIALTGGAYQARSIIASAQRQLNLYAEPMPEGQGEPAPMAYYPMPGLRRLGTAPGGRGWRGLYQAGNGAVYGVSGPTVWLINRGTAPWTFTSLGTITAGLTTPVGMVDNGVEMIIVDGSPNGWTVTLATNAFAVIADTDFAGGVTVDYLDTFFVSSIPGTAQFQVSDSLAATYDPLWIVKKAGFSDRLTGLRVAKRELWLIGEQTTEIWFVKGGADFPLETMPGVFVDHGCLAPYSIAQIDDAVIWLSHDRFGRGVVLMGRSYKAQRISTFAIEAEIATYANTNDAIGYTFGIAGHEFYQLTFPSADKTWVFDLTTGLALEASWIDGDGLEHRHRGQVARLIDDEVVVGDWENGNIYALDLATATDNGAPIKRVRSFPHMVADGKRMMYRQFLADMQVAIPAVGDTEVWLDWSDDRGVSFGNPVLQSLGLTGEYRTSVQFQRLGMARDRVFRLTWNSNHALQGAFVEAQAAAS